MIVPIDPEIVRAQIVPEATTSLCLMASFLQSPRIPANLLEYMRQLAIHFDHMIFITNDCHGYSCLENQNELPIHCKVVFVKNEGADFGMWYKILGSLQASPRLQRICIVNDSCWIVNDLDNAFARAKRNSYKFWGLLKSFEVRPHIQSFFAVAEEEAVRPFLEFFHSATMESNISKHDLIHQFEIGLSDHMAKRFDLHSHYSMDNVLQLVSPRQLPPNASVNYWDVLLILGYPLLKKKRVMIVNEVDFLRKWIDPYFLKTLM